MNQKDLQSLLDIYQSAQIITAYVEGLSEPDFSRTLVLQDAVVRRLLIVGEAAGRVSEESCNSLPDIEWAKIRGLRNRLVHEYDNISLEVIWNITQTEIPELVEKLRLLVPIEEQLSVFKTFDDLKDPEED